MIHRFLINSIVNSIVVRVDFPYFTQQSRDLMNGARVNVREEEINHEFLNRSHLRKHRETRHWPTYLTNFFGHRHHVFAHICANRRKSREARGNIAWRVSVCQLSASDRYSDKDESKSSAESCGSDFWSVRFFTEFALRRTISRYFENMTAWFAHVFLFFPAGYPWNGLKKSLFALRDAFCIEYFPIPKCPLF